MMNLFNRAKLAGLLLLSTVYTSCSVPARLADNDTLKPPASFVPFRDTTRASLPPWKTLFADQYLQSLIDTALVHNQELGIALQEIEVARNEVRTRHAQLLPSVNWGAGAGVEKVGRYTSQGAGDASTEITKGKPVPDILPDYQLGAFAGWEIDIWKKLHNAKKAAVNRYLSTIEGRNFVQTNLVAEIASSYFELLALDNQLAIVQQTIGLQQHVLDVVKIQKQAAAATELAVKKFQADVLNSKSLEFEILQQQSETENRINFLVGRYPQKIERNNDGFLNAFPLQVNAGLPSQMIENRADIRQAEYELKAAKLDVNVARAAFYPSLEIGAGLGIQSFSPSYFLKSPESIFFSLAGDLAGPLINKNAIKATYATATARQLQAMYEYERRILNGYVEVSTQLSNINNLSQQYAFKKMEVDTLNATISISDDLFRSAHADYLEVLMTQRDALQAKLDLIDTRLKQYNAVVTLYQALGGGWR